MFDVGTQFIVRNIRKMYCRHSTLKAKFHYAIQLTSWFASRELDSVMEFGLYTQVADLRVRVVCVSQAGRKQVEIQLRTGL